MPEKKAGKSEDKMTKDLLERWKRIASKYEAPPDSQVTKKAEQAVGRTPIQAAEEDLDRFLDGLMKDGTRGPAKPPYEREEKELDELLAQAAAFETTAATTQGDEDSKRRVP